MSCSRSNSAFANKIKKRLREKINTDLPAAYPRAFTWAVYGSDGMLIVRRTQEQESSKVVDLPEGTVISAASLGTALTRLLEAAVGFANTVTSGSDSSADIIHVAGSKYLFTAARFGAGFVLAFFSYLTAPETPAPSSQGTTSPEPTTANANKTEEEKPSSEPNAQADSSTQLINDEDIARNTFGGDEPLRKLLADLNYIITDVRVASGASTPAARRTSVDEPMMNAGSGSISGNAASAGATPASSGTTQESRARHKSQMH